MARRRRVVLPDVRVTLPPVLGTDRHAARRLAIAIICSGAVAMPTKVAASPATPTADTGPARPYDGPRGVEGGVETPPPPEPPPDVAEDVEDVEDDATNDEPAVDDDEPDAEPVPFDWRDTPQGEAASRKIRGGLILTSGGLLLGFGAAILGTTDPCRRLAGNGCQREARTRATLTMGIPAAFVLAAGATLLGLGLTQRKRVRSSILVDVAAGRHGGGLSLVGRF